jgi:hypothetical protein
MPLTARSLTVTHGSGVEGCKILKQWHGREMNFSRGKSRIFITFRGTQGILSNKISGCLHVGLNGS